MGYITDEQIEEIDKVLSDALTLKALKAITKDYSIQVVSTSLSSYAPLKSDYINAVASSFILDYTINTNGSDTDVQFGLSDRLYYNLMLLSNYTNKDIIASMMQVII